MECQDTFENTDVGVKKKHKQRIHRGPEELSVAGRHMEGGPCLRGIVQPAFSKNPQWSVHVAL